MRGRGVLGRPSPFTSGSLARHPAGTRQVHRLWFLEFLYESEAEKTIKFDIPSIALTDDGDRDTTLALVWNHSDVNEQFCPDYA